MSDILPTIVWPQDAENYLDEANTQHVGLDQEIAASSASPEFKSAWATYYGADDPPSGWRGFYAQNHGQVGFFGVSGVMDQTDRYLEQLKGWRDAFAKAGGKPVSPTTVDPGQGTPTPAGSENVKSAATHIAEGVGAGLVIAAVVWVGVKLRRLLGVPV